MATVMQVVQRLLPHGTRRGVASSSRPVSVDWRLPPLWPPDLFAVAATLVSLSGAYAHSSVGGRGAEAAAARVARIGDGWATLDPDRAILVFKDLEQLWATLLAAGREPVSDAVGNTLPPWCRAALELLAVADQASSGIGFRATTSANVIHRQYEALERSRRTATLCDLVPPEECCVQPKARTPQVGCTLRSLTHHLALLPPIGEVSTRYLVNPAPLSEYQLNLLLVPFPYQISDDAIRRSALERAEGFGRFRVRQTWFPSGDPVASGTTLAHFLKDLVAAARRRARCPVHGVVLSELALDPIRASLVAHELKRTGIKLFITGVLASAGRHRITNDVRSYLFAQRELVTSWVQSKHHRWKLDGGQIASYRLRLPREQVWWEDIDVKNRSVTVYNFHEGAMLATLVCEDLARIEPVQPVLRAIGPNLLVALLMDGPQYDWRWASRYATVLADDPGTSVLTLTSLGMVARYLLQKPPEERRIPVVALWKDSSQARAREIALEPGSHAVLLELKLVASEERTLDRRSDGGATIRVEYVAERCIRHQRPPAWLTVPSIPLTVGGEP